MTSKVTITAIDVAEDVVVEVNAITLVESDNGELPVETTFLKKGDSIDLSVHDTQCIHVGEIQVAAMDDVIKS